MKILVTGGAGFVGSNLIEYLLNDLHEIICIDNFDNFYNPEIKRNNIKICLAHNNFTLIEGDIRDEKRLLKIFSSNNIDIVVHLAAKVGVRPSILEPRVDYNVNVNGTLEILEAMKKHNVKKMIFVSSSSVYGNNKIIPFSEDHNVDFPISPYAASKKAAELLCHTYHHLYDFDIFCLRLFTVYGPRQRPDLAIHKFTKMIFDNQPITIYGNGSTKRDYTFIDDIVNGITGAIKNLHGYDIFNLGESKPIGLLPLIDILEKEIGKKVVRNYYPMQPGDVNVTYSNIDKAKKCLGYSPKVDIKDGIKAFIKWYSECNIK